MKPKNNIEALSSAVPLDCRVRHELDSFKHLILNKVKKGECEGNCETHLGEIKAVRVYDRTHGDDWGWFAYCENAIKEDTNRGMGIIDA